VAIERRQIQVKESREVRELRGKILGMEMELCILSKDLERFKLELSYNLKMLTATNENLKFLRSSDAAVSLPEYRKIIQQQNLLDMRVKLYRKKIQPLEQVVGKKEDYLKKDMEVFEEVYREQFKNNILEFKSVRS